MEFDPRTGLEILDEDTCWELLRSEPVGRIAIAVNGRQELWPVNFAATDGAVYVRTESGAKMNAIADGDVAFEVDAVSAAFESGWSVIARGRFVELTEELDIQRAELLKLRAWSLAGKSKWLALRPVELTGRRIVKASEGFSD